MKIEPSGWSISMESLGLSPRDGVNNRLKNSSSTFAVGWGFINAFKQMRTPFAIF